MVSYKLDPVCPWGFLRLAASEMLPILEQMQSGIKDLKLHIGCSTNLSHKDETSYFWAVAAQFDNVWQIG